MRLLWEETAWQDYCAWQMEDKKTLKRINALLKDIQRESYDGIGKPEPLRGNLSGWWSRRIDDTNRIVYSEKDGAIIIASVKGHYEEQLICQNQCRKSTGSINLMKSIRGNLNASICKVSRQLSNIRFYVVKNVH